eukprot:TRINITY_DN6644_c0_g1_i5.p1 TRINITY_DN6644_c0_g1~~TRINITY_DN6644_c0_g1_i5.p1  ORF type:complete len:109 (+),score=13.03 TRINITY_DN6644_c0_g1_i5:227-553(+)
MKDPEMGSILLGRGTAWQVRVSLVGIQRNIVFMYRAITQAKVRSVVAEQRQIEQKAFSLLCVACFGAIISSALLNLSVEASISHILLTNEGWFLRVEDPGTSLKNLID